MITLDSLNLQKISPEELGELLITAKKAYYTTDKPIMDDHTFDTLEDILRKKNPYHRIFSKVGNPNFDTGFDKKQHIIVMGSQNKTNTYQEMVHYFELKKIPTDTDFVVQPKCDGISLEIEYKNGQLVDAITRGDGHIGDVITQNVIKMKNFIPKISDFTGSIRCEIVMTDSDFKKINQISTEKYSNSRNAVSGISQRLDGKHSEYCSLFTVDAFSKNKKFSTELEKIKFLKKNKIVTVDTFRCTTFNQIEEKYQQFISKTRKLYPFEIDGLVVKINDLKLQQSLGSHNNRPKGQVAYKFPARTSQTRIKKITWQVGPLGMITPVAEIDPIEISGAVITFASLANYDLIKEKNININDIAEVSRRGDVIPHIDKIINKVTPGHITAPVTCPSCGTKLIIDSKFLRCPNTKNCPDQILGSLKLFCDVLEIKGISDKTIKKLHQLHLLKTPGDFYKLKVSDFENIFGLGKKSGTNIVNQIQNKRNITLKQIFDSASIPNFSSARIRQLISAGFTTPEKILNITIKDLEALPGIQKTLATKIKEGIELRKEWVQSILSQVTIKKTIQHKSAISGLTFAITGKLSHPRKELEEQIIFLGGKPVNSVTSNTNYLITNETNSNSDKFISAKKFGTKIISEDDFYSLALKR